MIKSNITKSATSCVYGFVDSTDEKDLNVWILNLDEGVNEVEVYIGGVKVIEKRQTYRDLI
ncbi:MAG: hypothetical protein QXW71_06070 [Thermoplasmata archaeon]